MTGLEAQIQELQAQLLLLKAENAQLKKLLFGAKRERYVPTQDPAQGSLFDEQAASDPVEQVEVALKPANRKKRTKPVKRNTFPEKLRRQTEVIQPEGVDMGQLVKIGEDITEILAYVPADFYVKQLVRPRFGYKTDEDQGVLQAPIPERLIAKGMVDESVIAQIAVEKILYHTPVHRFHKKLKQAGINFISQTNLYNWFHAGAAHLVPLYDLLKADVLAQPYIQVDETRIQVLSKNKPGASHRGQMWVMHSPKHRAVVFAYDPARSGAAAKSILNDFEGILQADGYTVYEQLNRSEAIDLANCMSHARRKFIDAQNTDPPRAQYFLQHAQRLYKIEQRAREEKMTDEQRLRLRQQEAVPILEELGQWLKEQFTQGQILPKSPIGQAIAYTLQRWKGLCAYAHDGRIEIDNNLIENCIRPVALGRKNFLFAGSDEAAQNLACLYSIIGTADKYGLNMHRYLTWLLRQVATHKVDSNAIKWLPHRMDKNTLVKFRD
ncbi:MAG: IS66 family transposase [Saprospirales bacterium]|nr:IS66 family transposase [Saprospirales bacterium]